MRVDRVVPPAKARLLIAAEGGRDVALAKAVDGDSARPQHPRAAQRPLCIGGKDRRSQAVIGIIGDADCGLKAIDLDHRQDGSENFLARKLVVIARDADDGRLDMGAVMGLAAHHYLRVLGRFQI
ncbi:hypothetical protein D9M70_553880 [compost metagenome]